MNADEKAIMDYLKGWPHNYISGREIARKVGGKNRYEEDRFWAAPLLAAMVTKEWIETDSMGYFRIRAYEKKKNKNSRNVSPQILRILKSSGKKFEGVTIDNDIEESELPTYPKANSSTPGSNGGISTR